MTTSWPFQPPTPWQVWAQQMTTAVNTLVSQQGHILALLNTITMLLTKEGQDIMATQKTLTDLQDAVNSITAVDQSVVTLLQGLSEQIQAAAQSGDDQAVEALAQKLHEQADMLSQAVVANTPVVATAPSETTQPAEATPPADAPTTEQARAPHREKESEHKRHK